MAGRGKKNSKGGKSRLGEDTLATSRQIMEAFLQGAATPTNRNREEEKIEQVEKNVSKKPLNTESASDEEWQSEMRTLIEKEAGLTEEQTKKVMTIVLRAFRLRVVQEAKKVAMHAVVEEYDTRKSQRSIIIHRADLWVIREDAGLLNLTLAEKVTVAIHQLTGGAVSVLDAYALGRWDSPTPATAVLVTFGSRTQKTTFFKLLARKGSNDPKLKVMSCRDVFPKRLVNEAKKLAEKGSALRSAGSIAAFRVVARGQGCIPILEVKGWVAEGHRESQWKIFSGEEPKPQRKGGGSSPRGLTKPGTMPSTLVKPTPGISRLSVVDGGQESI